MADVVCQKRVVEAFSPVFPVERLRRWWGMRTERLDYVYGKGVEGWPFLSVPLSISTTVSTSTGTFTSTPFQPTKAGPVWFPITEQVDEPRNPRTTGKASVGPHRLYLTPLTPAERASMCQERFLGGPFRPFKYEGSEFHSSAISLTFALVLTGVCSRVSGWTSQPNVLSSFFTRFSPGAHMEY